MSLFELGIYVIIHLQTDYRTGIWHGSAPRIMATAPRGTKLRDIQRALEHLEEQLYLKSFRKQGKRGNTRYLIHKFTVRSGALKGMRLNAANSENCTHLIYEPCAVVDAENDTQPAAEGDVESVAENAPIQEVKSKKQGSKKKTSAIPTPEALELSNFLRQRILENNQNARITDLQVASWAAEADLMMRRDGRTEVQIRDLIEWCQRHSFWKGVVLSMGSLRQKFDRLTVQKNTTGGNDGTRGGYPRAAIAPEAGKYGSVPVQRVKNTGN